MPYVQLRIAAAQPLSAARLGAEATRLMVEVMGKRREVTVVEVITTASAWFAAGAPVAGPAAYVDIKITRGSNREEQKASLLAEFQHLLAEELGPLAAPAYVVIDEIPGADWGYEGRTQASRLAGKL